MFRIDRAKILLVAAVSVVPLVALVSVCHLTPMAPKAYDFGRASTLPGYGALAWNGARFGFAWSGTAESGPAVYFQPIADIGTPIGSPTIAYEYGQTPNHGSYIELVWNGEEFGLFWRCDLHWGISFVPISSDGQVLGDVTRVATPGRLTTKHLTYDATWTGTEYGVAWYYTGSGDIEGGSVMLTRLSATGELLGESTLGHFSYFGGPNRPVLAGHGSNYAVCWVANVNTLFVRIVDGDNENAGSWSIPFDLGCNCIDVAWSGQSYNVIWEELGEISYVLLGSDGHQHQNVVNLLKGDSPSLVWNGHEFAIAWYGYSCWPMCPGMMHCGGELDFTRFSASGQIIQSLALDGLVITVPSAPGIFWKNPGYAITYKRDYFDDNCDLVISPYLVKHSKSQSD